MNTNWRELCLDESSLIKQAMELLSTSGSRIVLVVDDKMVLRGTVTDGDIRRGILRGLTLESVVFDIMCKNPITINAEMSSIELRSMFRDKGIFAAPIVDQSQRVIGLEMLSGLIEDQSSNVSVLIMAGGFGKRLGDLTKELPKPMLPLGNKPVLEHIIDGFVNQGFKKFFISTHYKSQAIKQYFNDGENKGIRIDYLEEETPLGTAGCLYLLKNRVDDIFIVINGDLLVEFDFNFLINFHKKNNALVTMCVRQSNFHVPYGVVETEKMLVKNIIEKPHYSHTISAGIYCFSKDALAYMRELCHIDMPDLVQNIIQTKQCVMAFPLHEYWVDIGSFDTLNKAREEHTK